MPIDPRLADRLARLGDDLSTGLVGMGATPEEQITVFGSAICSALAQLDPTTRAFCLAAHIAALAQTFAEAERLFEGATVQ